MSTDVAKFVESTISDNDIAIFAKSTCPYCRRARGIVSELNTEGKKVAIYDINTDGHDGPAIQAYLLEKTGQKTVPNIFIRQKHIGGSDNLAAKKEEGVLQQLVDGTASKL